MRMHDFVDVIINASYNLSGIRYLSIIININTCYEIQLFIIYKKDFRKIHFLDE